MGNKLAVELTPEGRDGVAIILDLADALLDRETHNDNNPEVVALTDGIAWIRYSLERLDRERERKRLNNQKIAEQRRNRLNQIKARA